MAVYQCKMCGGSMEIQEGSKVAVCEYCGTKQTLPNLDSEKKAALYDRAGHFRRSNDYDKAMSIYEQIVSEDREDAEAYWSLVLCRYGIEYVEDPKTHKRVPTVNRAQLTSVLLDEDYQSALRYADVVQKSVYEEEAKAIDEIQKGILSISKQEDPYDIFICYKETDADGRRTQDSVLATDLYRKLTEEGYKVFFARVTLEDKLGSAYEPYIFAALNSAKVMLAVGTKPEYFNAVWVKNEWSRYLAIMKKDSHKLLIPCYRDMDPYDLPEEFAYLQSQDMSKIGFQQDLIRGIRKVVSAKAPQKAQLDLEDAGNLTELLLTNAFVALENGNFSGADTYCNKVLEKEPENVKAYVGKLMAELHVSKEEDLRNCQKPFDHSENYKKAMRLADENLAMTLRGYINSINERNESKLKKAKKTKKILAITIPIATVLIAFALLLNPVILPFIHYQQGEKLLAANDFENAAAAFAEAGEFSDAAERIKECYYKQGETFILENKFDDAEAAFRRAEDYNGASSQIDKIHEELVPKAYYDQGTALLENGQFDEARAAFTKAEKYSNAEEMIDKCYYDEGETLLANEQFDDARAAFSSAGTYSDAEEMIHQCYYNEGDFLSKNKQYYQAGNMFMNAGDYKDAVELAQLCYYTQGEIDYESHDYRNALKNFDKIPTYKDAEKKAISIRRNLAGRYFLAASKNHSVGLLKNGKVVTTKCKDESLSGVSHWKDIISIAASDNCTVGLRADGSIITTGKNNFQYELSSWKNMVSVVAGRSYIAGVCSDGTVSVVGMRDKEISEWTNIISISAGPDFLVGLKSDGTVVAEGNNFYGQCDVKSWKDIIAIASGDIHTVGLRSDGTVIATKISSDFFDNGQCNVGKLHNIVAISAGKTHSVALSSDGKVYAIGGNEYGQCDVSSWNNIENIAAGGYHTIGIKSDGTAIAIGNNDDYQCDISSWTNIGLPKLK